jgi:uncharacterized membrane protein
MSAAALPRIASLDAARGLAVVAMVAFHLIWDLGNFGYIDQGIPYSAGIKLFGHATAVAFLGISGISLVLAHKRGERWRRFWRRFLIVTGAAGLVTLGTYLAFPQAFVFFGILHCIALASVLAAPLLLAPWPVSLFAAFFTSLAPLWFRQPLFDAPWLSWVGLSTIEPLTYDYRPLAPWAGALFAGVAAAQFWHARALPALGANWGGGPLYWLGRHSLPIYLLHQPALFAVFNLLAFAGAAPVLSGAGDFVDACVERCEKGGGATAICRETCACTAEQATRDETLLAIKDASERTRRINEIALECLAQSR